MGVGNTRILNTVHSKMMRCSEYLGEFLGHTNSGTSQITQMKYKPKYRWLKPSCLYFYEHKCNIFSLKQNTLHIHILLDTMLRYFLLSKSVKI